MEKEICGMYAGLKNYAENPFGKVYVLLRFIY